MRLLVLGGTRFVGRHAVAAALAAGHDVTLLHRGRTGPGLFADAEHVLGDRHAGGLAALRGRTFDAVLDVTAYTAGDVRAVADVVPDAHHVLVSSISVYGSPTEPGADESLTPEPDDDYGRGKLAAERALLDAHGERAAAVRPGIVAGPHDHTERFVHWVRRRARGGRFLAAEPAQPVQLVDARDLGAFLVRVAAERLAGVFNAVRPPVAMAELLAACPGDGEPVWAGERFLLDRGVAPWEDLPLWLPASERAFLMVDASRAAEAGLEHRPLERTAADVLAWDRERPPGEREERLDPEREAALLAALG